MKTLIILLILLPISLFGFDHDDITFINCLSLINTDINCTKISLQDPLCYEGNPVARQFTSRNAYTELKIASIGSTVLFYYLIRNDKKQKTLLKMLNIGLGIAEFLAIKSHWMPNKKVVPNYGIYYYFEL
jgi:hypothetical protein